MTEEGKITPEIFKIHHDLAIGSVGSNIARLTGTKSNQCPHLLKRIGYGDPKADYHCVYLTSNFKLAAKTIAEINKERWQIEAFFGRTKQNPKIKSFIGNSRNAMMTQLYVAEIAFLLLFLFKWLSKIPESLNKFLRIIQINLSRLCSLEEIFETPHDILNKQFGDRQLLLSFL